MFIIYYMFIILPENALRLIYLFSTLANHLSNIDEIYSNSIRLSVILYTQNKDKLSMYVNSTKITKLESKKPVIVYNIDILNKQDLMQI